MGVVEGTDCTPSLLWFVSEGVGEGIAGLVVASGLEVGFFIGVASSSDVFLLVLLFCENKTERVH